VDVTRDEVRSEKVVGGAAMGVAVTVSSVVTSNVVDGAELRVSVLKLITAEVWTVYIH